MSEARTPEFDLRHQRWWDYTQHYFGFQVVSLREVRRWSVDELSQRSKVPVKRIKEIEAGNLSRATTLDVSRLASAFDVAANAGFVSFGSRLPMTYVQESKAQPAADGEAQS